MDLYQALVAVEPATLIITIGNLFIQMFLVKKFLLDKVLAVLDKRREVADEQIVAAQTARDEAMAIKQTYEENMRQARNQANELIDHAQKTAAARSSEMIAEAQQQAAQIKEKAAADVELEKKNALNEVKDTISGLAMEIASKVVEREINEKDHKALVDEFIEKIGESA